MLLIFYFGIGLTFACFMTVLFNRGSAEPFLGFRKTCSGDWGGFREF